ncbi:alpha/beta-hydrolase [Dendrothele bispora CBS 962.96]|uniref:Alpha/beta-hydrolase n=1 Tax=Dendrothele bispora (strain CBS 962.96) TaxID=1314807 RepID=A0A4S8M3D8_DENBC|nr:alpha/beta-hydrolase [Dendrothele bispora CBS 962.96]
MVTPGPTNRVSTKLYIPHPSDPTCSIAGVLEQLTSTAVTDSDAKATKRIALILHGAGGHKDYLYQKRLAQRLPLDSFRFDFRGNHETPGVWRQGGFAGDVVDLRAVVDYLSINYGYKVDLVVGHSRGSIVAFKWICTTEEGRNISAFVNASGRYRMRKLLDAPGVNVWQENILKQGYHLWTPIVARKQVSVQITGEDLDTFVNWDTSYVWDQFPSSIDVLTIHGLKDQLVSPYDGVIYARALNPRSPGTHNLHLMEDADHNFTGRQDEVVDTILEWWDKQQERSITNGGDGNGQGSLKTGVWLSGIRGKL